MGYFGFHWGYVDTWEKFVEVYRGLLKTLDFHNLRLKGSKVVLLGKTLDFLGKRVTNGQIMPDPHMIGKIQNYHPDDIVTVGQLLSFIGMISYISDHIFQASVVLHKLRQAAKGQLADHIKWTFIC